jgi:hypothetical protein
MINLVVALVGSSNVTGTDDDHLTKVYPAFGAADIVITSPGAFAGAPAILGYINNFYIYLRLCRQEKQQSHKTAQWDKYPEKPYYFHIIFPPDAEFDKVTHVDIISNHFIKAQGRFCNFFEEKVIQIGYTTVWKNTQKAASNQNYLYNLVKHDKMLMVDR